VGVWVRGAGCMGKKERSNKEKVNSKLPAMLPLAKMAGRNVKSDMMSKSALLLIMMVVLIGSAEAQSIFSPNYALKSPMTVEVLSIETVAGTTTVNLSIENQLDEGYFCIDKDSYIYTDKGSRIKLLSLTGLPFCPDSYRFTHKGEMKFFTMSFPAVEKNTDWIDLVEECGENCLAIYGISLDLSLNSELNTCFLDIDKGRTDAAIKKFESLLTKLEGSGNPILGSIYLNLISLYTDKGDKQRADILNSEFQGIMIAHKEKFLDLLD